MIEYQVLMYILQLASSLMFMGLVCVQMNGFLFLVLSLGLFEILMFVLSYYEMLVLAYYTYFIIITYNPAIFPLVRQKRSGSRWKGRW